MLCGMVACMADMGHARCGAGRIPPSPCSQAAGAQPLGRRQPPLHANTHLHPAHAEVICDVKPQELQAALVGRTIVAAKRRGKQVGWVPWPFAAHCCHRVLLACLLCCCSLPLGCTRMLSLPFLSAFMPSPSLCCTAWPRRCGGSWIQAQRCCCTLAW